MTFKPGVYMLVADEEWPSDATTAYQAFQIAGIDVKREAATAITTRSRRRRSRGGRGPSWLTIKPTWC